MTNEFIPTARTGEMPNEYGAYGMNPDYVAEWKRGRNFVKAKLLKLADESWLFDVDHDIRGCGRRGPLFAGHNIAPNMASARSGVTVLIEELCNTTELLSARDIKDLRGWAQGLLKWPRNTQWIGADDADDDEEDNGDIVPAPVQGEVVESQGDAADRARALAEQLGYDLPANSTNPDMIQRDIAANMRRSVEACLEIGKGLLVLKAACSHGDFVRRMDGIGIEERLGQRFMQAALKFSKAASTPLLVAAGNQTKLLELLVLDDEQIEELATGQTGELKLDDVACMSVKELRAALREARAEREAAESVAKKNREIADKAETEAEKLRRSPQKIANEAAEEAEEAGRRRGLLRAAVSEIHQAHKEVESAIAKMMTAIIDYMDLEPSPEDGPPFLPVIDSFYESEIDDLSRKHLDFTGLYRRWNAERGEKQPWETWGTEDGEQKTEDGADTPISSDDDES
jgi:hypothetical protein